MPTQKTYKTSLLPPPGLNNGHALILPTRTIPSPSTNPKLFNDAVAVRLEVFVDEQKCPAEFEVDEDDSRCWHWVIYDTTPDESLAVNGALPVGVVRLVPPPHASHESFIAAYAADGDPESRYISKDGFDYEHEPYIKFGRVAVLKNYRGAGVARKVMEEALTWAQGHPDEINKAFEEFAGKDGNGDKVQGKKWRGLALVHAQVEVERFYQRLGFETDEGLGRWSEEGIEHVGMWRRLDV
ncbi:acyl-CoA N-acyltransferase [Aspergillus filifer]